MSTADNSQNQKLRFRIVECSGEDPQHPVSELLTGSPQSSGWQSQRFCTFPQYITFQFMTPVRLNPFPEARPISESEIVKQLQFLSHENKIPTKLELFTAVGDYKSGLSLNDTKFKKLGYLSLDTNEKSGFTLRELKTVYIEAPCVYLRIVFEKCHINKFNFFNQVGLIAIAAFGDPLNQSPIKNPNSMDRQERAEAPSFKGDDFVIRKLRELEGNKFRAIDREEFEEAHFIKQEILKVKQIGTQLQRFEERKLVAQENEDYETATNLKREIERLRDAISLCGTSPEKRQNGYAPSPKPEKSLATYNSYDQGGGSQKGSLAEIPEPRLSAKKPTGNNREPKPQRSFNTKPTQNYQDEEQEEAKYVYDDQGEDEEYDDYRNSSTRIAYEDQIIPALLKKADHNNSIEAGEYAQNNNMPTEAEKLSPTNQKLAENILPIIGEELCKKVFSKHWNLREDAIKTLTPEISKISQSKIIKNDDSGTTFIALLGVINYTIIDRISQVATKSLTLLKNIMTLKPNMANTTTLKNDLTIYTDNIVNCLLERLGDSNSKIREQVEDTYLSMVRNPVISCSFCVNALSRIHAGRGKNGQTVRHILTKLRLLQTIIKEFKINNHDVPYNPVIEYIVDKIEHPNNEIRSTVTQLLVEIFCLVGDKIRADLENVSLVYREAIEKEFEVIAPKQTPSKLLTKENKLGSNPVKPALLSKKGSILESKTSTVGKPEQLQNTKGVSANPPAKSDFSSSKGKGEVLPSINGPKAGSVVLGGIVGNVSTGMANKTENTPKQNKEEESKTPKKPVTKEEETTKTPKKPVTKKEGESKTKNDGNTSVLGGAGKQEAGNKNTDVKSPPASKKTEELPKIPNNNQGNQQTGKAK